MANIAIFAVACLAAFCVVASDGSHVYGRGFMVPAQIFDTHDETMLNVTLDVKVEALSSTKLEVTWDALDEDGTSLCPTTSPTTTLSPTGSSTTTPSTTDSSTSPEPSSTTPAPIILQYRVGWTMEDTEIMNDLNRTKWQSDCAKVQLENLTPATWYIVDLEARLKGNSEANYHNTTKVETKSADSNDLSPGEIAGIVVGVIVGVAILVAVIFFIYKKKIPCYKGGKQPRYHHGDGRVSGPSIPMARTRSPLSEEQLRSEFQATFAVHHGATTPGRTMVNAKKNQNQKLNRYGDILPYDQTLVKLNSGHYINASYLLDKKFVATQDPLPTQDDDFWQLIWECKVRVILRLSTEENATAVYLQDGSNLWVVGQDEINVRVKNTYNAGAYYRRTIEAEKDGDKRKLEHFQMMSWTHQSLPTREDLLSVITVARNSAKNLGNKYPVLIHCGAGAGRTGTVIAIWQMIDLEDLGHDYHIGHILKDMRNDRTSMIQDENQYVCAYNCVQDYRKNPHRWETGRGDYEN